MRYAGGMLRAMHYRGLGEYLDALPRGGHRAFSDALDITAVYLSQLAVRQEVKGRPREPSPELCVRIERATHGVVPRQFLRSDWSEIWPELTAIERKPAAPVEA